MMKKYFSLVLPFGMLFAFPQKDVNFNETRAFGYLKTMCSFGPRNPGSVGHQAGRDFIVKTVSPFADDVVLQEFPFLDPYSGQTLTMTNVIARFSLQKSKRIWIATHWDTRPRADMESKQDLRTKPILGANDGASGVAVLLEIAQHLHKRMPQIGVDLVFLDGEDFGKSGDLKNYFLGSRFLSTHLIKPKPEYCILIDMIGDRDLTLKMEGYSYDQARDLIQLLWDQAEMIGLPSFENRVGASIEDDHVILFEKGGIPSVDIIDFDYSRNGKNLWHTLEDTPDKCSSNSLGIVGKLLLYHIYNR